MVERGSGGWIGVRAGILGSLAMLAAAALSLCEARAAIVHVAASGLVARIHTAPEIEQQWLTSDDLGVWLRHPVAGEVELLRGPSDPRLPRRDIARFEPLAAENVVAALDGITGVRPALSVDIFLLPSVPAAALGSFSRRAAIFLSPAFGPVDAGTVAWLVAHEMGHVLTWAYLDGRPERWAAYLAMRGLCATEGGPAAPHAERVREIIAEDLRFLFGGPLANQHGTIENRRLPLPTAVAGLPELLAGFCQGSPLADLEVQSRAFPNPARGEVRVEMLAPSSWTVPGASSTAVPDDQVELAVFDLRGRLVVRRTGAFVDNGRALMIWDGRDRAGVPVASGRYLYLITWEGRQGRGSLLIAR